jgi:hypothetical protein
MSYSILGAKDRIAIFTLDDIGGKLDGAFKGFNFTNKILATGHKDSSFPF